jgi:voltage-gated potassium channel
MNTVLKSFYATFSRPLFALVLVHVVGTIGYRYIGGPKYSILDSFYMTFITVATIGYGEVIDLSHSPAGRVFTVFIAATGMGIVYYMMAKMTTSLVAGELNLILRRQKMLKRMSELKHHYIVCGIGRVGSNVAHELALTGRQYIVVDTNQEHINDYRERYSDITYLHGDASEDELLEQAGIKRAAGVFAVTGDDAKNLVITLSAKQLNPAARIVARCHEVNYIEKIRRVGADAIVSPDFTGGMRIASSMIRPQVVSFLDEMLRTDRGLRVEEVDIPQQFAGESLARLVPKSRDYVLMAVRSNGEWIFNPEDDFTVTGGNTLVLMTTPAGRIDLEKRVGIHQGTN